MAGAAQWTVDAFYGELNKLAAAGRDVIAGLNAQKLTLQNAYTKARTSNDQPMMTFLQPLIHKNSQLRLRYRDYVAKFNEIVGAVSGFLRNAGLQVPATLSGLGLAPALIIIPATAVVMAGIAWGIIHEMQSGKAAIDNALKTQAPDLLAIAQDPTKSAAERDAALKAYNELLRQAGIQPTDWIKDLYPVLGLVALIVLAPSVMKLIPQRGSA